MGIGEKMQKKMVGEVKKDNTIQGERKPVVKEMKKPELRIKY